MSVWDEWCNFGIVYATKRDALSIEQANLLKDYPDLSWSFSLGYHAALYKDNGPT